MIVVADASPIISLERVGHLHLMRTLFSTVLLPEQVHAEILAGAGGRELLESSSWLTCASVVDQAQLRLLEDSLDVGEAAAIVLALERHADLLLMDERQGRRVALEHGLQVIGVLGILVRARRRGLIASVKVLIERLVTDAGSRLSPMVVAAALRAVGEEP